VIWLLALLMGCTTVEEAAVQDIGKALSDIGHPMAEFKAARLDSTSSGGCTQTHPASMDVAVDYKPKLRKSEHTMKVRFHVHTLIPCDVRTEVLEDNGPKPVILDNAMASRAIGNKVCKALGATAVEDAVQDVGDAVNR